MNFKIGRRSIVFALAAALVAAAFSAVAFAAKGDPEHPHFLPKRFVGSPEISAIVLSPQTNTFVQLVFDRGTITAMDATAGTLTVQQGTGGTVWRTQVFTVPTTADIMLEGRQNRLNKPLSKLKVGEHVRVEQSGPVGGTLQVVRVDASRLNHDINFPSGN